MVDDILGVVKLVPVPKLAPPVDEANQVTIEDMQLEAVTDKFTVPAPHLDAGTGVNACGTSTETAPDTWLVAAGAQVPFTTQ